MTDLDDLSAMISNGSSLALAPDYSGCALAVVRRLIRRGVTESALDRGASTRFAS